MVDEAPVDVSEVREASGDEDVLLKTEGVAFTARLDPQVRVRVGSTIRLAVDPARFHFFDPATGLRLAHQPEPASLAPAT
jgi:multiple sugar transport system ATP-binding protein